MTTTERKRLRSPHQPVGRWIREAKRLAIYCRDGTACVWCGSGIEDGAALSLDHLAPKSENGTNDAWNLATCCTRCNGSRGNRSPEEFAVAVAAYLNHGVTGAQVLAHVMDCASRPVPMDEARALLARRGSVASAVASRRVADAE